MSRSAVTYPWSHAAHSDIRGRSLLRTRRKGQVVSPPGAVNYLPDRTVRTVQYDLFQRTLDERFEQWFASPARQQIAAEAASRALALRHAGFQRYGIKAICEAIRFDRHLQWGPETDAGDPYRLSNNYPSRLARHLMATVPDLAGFFETRELRGTDRTPRRAVVIPIKPRAA